MIHAHVETESRDCDGVYTSGWLMLPTFEEAESMVTGSGEIDFHNRVVADVVNTYSIMGEGRLTVKRLEDSDVRITWVEPTEEGYRHKEATICTDPCDLGDTPWSRDHTAEAAGY